MLIIFIKKYFYLIITAFLYLIFCLIIQNTPFFWDFATLAKITNQLYENGPFSYNYNQSNGGLSLLYAYYLDLIWNILGRSLLSSHIALTPFILGIVYELKKIFAHYSIPKYLTTWGMALIFIDSTIVTQIWLMGFDIALLYLFLASYSSILYRKYYKLSIFAILISLFSIRSSLLLLPIISYALITQKEKRTILLIFIPALFISIIHYAFIKNLIADHPSRQINSIRQSLKNIILILWKIWDFGRIIPFIITIVLFIPKRINKPLKQYIETKGLELFLMGFLLIFFYIVTMAPLSNPFGHRYFIPFYVSTIILLIYLIQDKTKITQNIIILSIITSSILGNFILYPVRFGNGWDTSLKSIPYFELKRDMDTWLKINKIKKEEVVGDFPFQASDKNVYLKGDTKEFQEFSAIKSNTVSYIIYSNIYNVFPQEVQKYLKENTVLVYEKKKGQIFMQIYKKK